MPPKVKQPLSWTKTLANLSGSVQFYWYIGHVASVFFFILIQVFGFFNKAKTRTFYQLTLISEMISYGLVLKQASLKKGNVLKKDVLRNVNVQYLLFATVLFVTSFGTQPWPKALYSYVIYSFFHSIAYFKANLLESLPVSLHVQAAINDKIDYITSNFNVQALYFAAFSELTLPIDFLWLLLTLPFSLLRSPGYTLIQSFLLGSVVVFLKARYDTSESTKAALQQLDSRILAILQYPIVPPSISRFYTVTVKGFIRTYIGPLGVPKASSVKKSQ